jgi:hypothetical protein
LLDGTEVEKKITIAIIELYETVKMILKENKVRDLTSNTSNVSSNKTES